MAEKKTLKTRVSAAVESFKDGQAKGAHKAMLEELFYDFYAHRKEVYIMNFVRGIMFGLGSVIGGTIIVALIIWILALFGGVPVIGEFFEGASDTINESKQ